MRLLLVEDEENLAHAIKGILTTAGHVVDVVYRGDEGWLLTQQVRYDLLILDWMVPGLSGVEVCRRLRAEGQMAPVLLLTARDLARDKVVGLDSGADDYMVKPFDIEELLARVRALLRRPSHFQDHVLTAGGVILNCNTMTAYREGKAIPLNRKEFQLLEYFLTHPGQVLTRDQILERLWEISAEPESNVVAAQVRLLRQKVDQGFGKPLIQTVYGVGYRFED
ncbi:two-component system response regulator RppA [Anthocerotibacter panamensis]|uniref:two-component system response regulator RppA n=1 Tax=Anthocerotibacter panamensis TaxID=2857077 RepID=UPI001C406A24|nr:two-component system response regulator RppA [Anthocerotibacter panamensis]